MSGHSPLMNDRHRMKGSTLTPIELSATNIDLGDKAIPYSLIFKKVV